MIIRGKYPHFNYFDVKNISQLLVQNPGIYRAGLRLIQLLSKYKMKKALQEKKPYIYSITLAPVEIITAAKSLCKALNMDIDIGYFEGIEIDLKKIQKCEEDVKEFLRRKRG